MLFLMTLTIDKRWNKYLQKAPLPRRAQRVRFWYKSKAHMQKPIWTYISCTVSKLLLTIG